MSTITIEKSVTINRPADEVWRLLSDENNLIKWQQNLHSHRTEQNRQHQVRKFSGQRVEMHQEPNMITRPVFAAIKGRSIPMWACKSMRGSTV